MVTGNHPLRRHLRFLWQLVALAIYLLSSQVLAAASTQPVPKQNAWNLQVEAALELLEQRGDTELHTRIDELEKARAVLATQRDVATAASRGQPIEATVLEGKLKLLGPVPEGGESEFSAKKREDLESQLYALRAPQRSYQEAYLRASAVIGQLDERIGELKVRRVTQGGQSPLWPGSWVAFFRESSAKIQSVGHSRVATADSPEFESRAALIGFAILLTLGGLAILIFGRKAAAARIDTRLEAAEKARSVALLAVARDFVGLAIALIGTAVMALGVVVVVGLYPEMGALPLVAFHSILPVVLAHWLGVTVFAPRAEKIRFVDLPPEKARLAVWVTMALGLAVGLETVLEHVESISPYSDAAAGVAPFVVLLLVASSLYLLAHIIERRDKEAEGATDAEHSRAVEESTQDNIDWSKLLTTVMRLSAMAAAALSAIGYYALARWAILPTVETLAVLAILITVYFRLSSVLQYYAPSGVRDSQSSLAIIRFAMASVMAVLALPLVAIFWGVRPAEISDILVLLRDGVTVGQTTISLGDVFIFIAVFVIGYLMTRWVQKILQVSLLKRMELDDGTRSAIITGLGYVGVMLSFVAAVGAAGIDLSNLAIIFGALSVGIGFGLQSIVSNFVSGIIMLIERPIKEGDTVIVGEYAGIVDKISVRATHIQSFDRDDVIVPNSELISGVVRNRTFSDRMTRIECAVGIAYDADVKRAFEILYDVASSHPNAMRYPAPNVVMEQLGDSALMLRLYCFVDDVSKLISARSDMYVDIVRKFADEGISIPFPQRDVHLKQSSASPLGNAE